MSELAAQVAEIRRSARSRHRQGHDMHLAGTCLTDALQRTCKKCGKVLIEEYQRTIAQ
jgi:hypothetical protein